MKVVVIKGGPSKEREISLRTGATFERSTQSLGYELHSFDLKTDNWQDFIAFIEYVKPDIILNALHGTFGEDGTIQTLLDEKGFLYTHSSAEVSALAMDKMKSKEIFQKHEIPVPFGKIVNINALDLENPPLPFPFILKPIAQGSTFGVFLIHSSKDLETAIQTWDDGPYGLMEQWIQGRELTVSIIDHDILGIAEILTPHDFYDYESKYTPGIATRLVPAPLTEKEKKILSALAIKAHKALGCTGLARSDFMYDGNTFYILEVNTQPGFTETSFAVVHAKQQGIPIEQLVKRIIDSAFENRLSNNLLSKQIVG